MSAPRLALFVVDTGPLITLAAADSLDYLLYPNVPIIIADAVFYEATRDSAKLGAQSIIDWVKAHRAHVEIAITNTYVNFDAAHDPAVHEAVPGILRTTRSDHKPSTGDRRCLTVVEVMDAVHRGEIRGMYIMGENAEFWDRLRQRRIVPGRVTHFPAQK